MKDSFSWLTPKQASELLGCTARNVTKLIVEGKLSATKEDGRFYIDKSELFRAYPKAFRKEKAGNSSLQAAENSRLEMENGLLKELSSQKDKEINFLREQINHISTEKIKMLEAIVNQTRIIEHKNQIKTDKEKSKSHSWINIFSSKK